MKNLFTLIFILISFFGLDQTTLFSDNFTTSQGTAWDNTSYIGSSTEWLVNIAAGTDFATKIDGGRLQITNDGSATGNSNGWAFSWRLPSEANGFSTTLGNSTGTVIWEFNMRQIRTDPSGFSSGSYGVAFILGGTSANAATTGNGYAVTLGESTTTDPLRLVSYTGGLQGTKTNILTSNTAGLTDFGTNYLSVRVTYTPSSNTWQLFVRNDGTSSFTDPTTGTALTSQGTATNNTYTSTSLSYQGGYWQGSTVATQTAFFDNFYHKICQPPTSPSFSAGVTTLCIGETSTYTASATGGSTVSYSILSGGASINSSTGVVSSVTSNFTVRATISNSCGASTTVDRSVTVNGPTISYVGSPFQYTQNTTISNLTPTTTGTSFSSTLPSGLNINSTTGVISGTPTGTQTATNYTITATANGCSNTTSISIAVRPSNDLCTNATSLPCGTSSLAGTTVGTLSETAPGTCVGSYGVWYTFTGDGQETTISVTSATDMGLYVGYGTCASRTLVDCEDLNGTNSTETTIFTSINGTTYYIYVAYYSTGTTTGTFTISRTCVTPYDPCPSITTINCGNSNSFTVASGGGIYDPPSSTCGFSTPGKEYIFSFTPTTTGNHLISQTTSFGYIDWFFKQSSNGCNGTGWTCIDDISNNNLGNNNVNISLTAGVTYYFLADPESTTGGNVSFSITCACTTPTNAGTVSLSQTVGTVNDNVTITTNGNQGSTTLLEWSYNNFTTVAGSTSNPTNPYNLRLNVYQSQVSFRTTSQLNNCPASTTSPVSITLALAPPYTNGTGSSDYISNVTLNTINNTSTRETNGDAYQDFTSQITELTKGEPYSISVTATNTVTPGQGAAAWIDYNGDGTFQTTENIMLKSPANTNSQIFTVPETAVSADVRMRVLSVWNGTPNIDAYYSTGYGYGEIEEYTVRLLAPISLPVELTLFDGIPYPLFNVIKWTTVSENNSSYFDLESSLDGENWRLVTKKQAAGNSTEEIKYSYIDNNIEPIIYYRLQQFDIDGQFKTYGPIIVTKTITEKKIIKYINLMGQEVNPNNTTGLIIEIYDDGTMKKMIR